MSLTSASRRSARADADPDHDRRRHAERSADHNSNRQLTKRPSLDSTDDNSFFYDFFDRNCAPSTPPPDDPVSGDGPDNSEENNNNNNNNNAEPERSEEGGPLFTRRNLNEVRPRSWLDGASGDCRRTRRRQTDPCDGKHFLSDYERALSSLLYQPYECRSAAAVPTVAYWLDPQRGAGGYSRGSSDSSTTTSSGSWGDGDCNDTDWRSGNPADADSDLDARTPRAPLGAPRAPVERQSTARPGPGHGRAMSQAECASASEVSVSCYRAVPATVSAVPVIPCANITNVRVVQTRTFTSTEAQTDDVIVGSASEREQRRRERRERRHQRRLLHEPLVDRLPDILNSHLPPPYAVGHLPPPPPPLVAGSPPPPPPSHSPLRFPFAIVPAGRRRSRLSPHLGTAEGGGVGGGGEPKSCCCGVAVSQTLSVRWFVVLIFLVGLCCALVGTILGAMKATGREHLTVSLLMIGVGIVLVAVSGVAWRLTAQDAPSCRALLGLRGGDDSAGEPNRRFVPRLPPSYGRPHHPYAAMMYPEFQYRAPPPSYQASMQEYRLRLLLLDRHAASGGPGIVAVSPPPTYHSQASSLLRAPLGFRGRGETHTPSQSEYSRPPSYRSRTSSRPDPASHQHSREPSGSEAGQTVNVIAVHPQHIIKLAPSPHLPTKGGKDANLVTIVQTGAASPGVGPVIVTISGQEGANVSHHCHQTEMEILAHL